MRRRRRLADIDSELTRLQELAGDAITAASEITKGVLRELTHLGTDAEDLLDELEESAGMVHEHSSALGLIHKKLSTYGRRLSKAQQLVHQYESLMEDFWELQER